MKNKASTIFAMWFWCDSVITAPSDQQHQTGCGQVPLPLLLHLRGHHGLQGQIWGVLINSHGIFLWEEMRFWSQYILFNCLIYILGPCCGPANYNWCLSSPHGCCKSRQTNLLCYFLHPALFLEICCAKDL